MYMISKRFDNRPGNQRRLFYIAYLEISIHFKRRHIGFYLLNSHLDCLNYKIIHLRVAYSLQVSPAMTDIDDRTSLIYSGKEMLMLQCRGHLLRFTVGNQMESAVRVKRVASLFTAGLHVNSASKLDRPVGEHKC